MSIETIDLPDLSGTDKEESEIEALIRRRRELQAEIMRASVDVCNANRYYNERITEAIETNAKLAEYGVNTEALARELQADVVHPASL